MKKIYNSISELVGRTPILALNNYKSLFDLNSNLYGKVEFFNPAGSVKDRIAKKMIETAIENGNLKEGSVIIEPTSGNTGIGLASIGASKGFKVILTMPETMSIERRNILEAYGAQIVLTPGAKGMKGAIEKAEELAGQYENSFIPSQFENPSNPITHYETTGPEIWNDLDGDVDIFVAGIGTGGTISGVGKYLKEKNPNIKIIGIEPEDSPIITEGKAGPHKIQGIGAGFIPTTLNTDIYDEIITVSNEDAFKTGSLLASTEGILVGISSGAAVYASKVIGQREENAGKNIVMILPDTGERYFSTEMYKAKTN